MAHSNTYMRIYRATHLEQVPKNNRKWVNANPESRIKWKVAHPSFDNWRAMMRRCYDSKDNRYNNYGGRGIKVCQRWHSFSVYEAEFGNSKPGNGYTVDRIDNDGDYKLTNVQWLTRTQNNRKRFQKEVV
jgi:hypothetical protein